jgi:hypothetical protein
MTTQLQLSGNSFMDYRWYLIQEYLSRLAPYAMLAMLLLGWKRNHQP